MQDCWPRLISLAIKYYVTEVFLCPVALFLNLKNNLDIFKDVVCHVVNLTLISPKNL